jgi:hypothetical protein
MSSTATGQPTDGQDGATATRTALLQQLRRPLGGWGTDATVVRTLFESLEKLQPADLSRDGAWLTGVWELRWSSSAIPYLTNAPWLLNLQSLDLAHGRAQNLVQLGGPLGAIGAISVEARIAVEGPQRVSVRFERGGWRGPSLGGRPLALLREVKQSFPAWLDITVVDEELRLCRGNAGTLFALLRRPDLPMGPWSTEAGTATAGQGLSEIQDS